MESVSHCDCLSRLTEAEKKKADAAAGGSFEKILIELQILKSSFGGKNTFPAPANREKTSRATAVRDVFLLRQKIRKESEPELPAFEKESPFGLEKLRRDPAAARKAPVFLEKRFELFGPAIISGLI